MNVRFQAMLFVPKWGRKGEKKILEVPVVNISDLRSLGLTIVPITLRLT